MTKWFAVILVPLLVGVSVGACIVEEEHTSVIIREGDDVVCDAGGHDASSSPNEPAKACLEEDAAAPVPMPACTAPDPKDCPAGAGN